MQNSWMRIALILSSALVGLALSATNLSAQTMAGGPYKITSSVQASGGGTSSGSGKVVEGTAGQTAAGGRTSGSVWSHDAGFWHATLTPAPATPSPTPTPTPTPTPMPTPSPTPTPAPMPSISINDVSQAEGNNGIVNFTFTVSLSAASTQIVIVNYATADGTAIAGSDYQLASGVLTFNPGETSKPVTLSVSGDTDVEPDETVFVSLWSPTNATIAGGQGVGNIINDDNAPSPTVQFSQASYSVQEDLRALSLAITRTGDTSSPASVDYVTTNGSATQRADFEYAAGTLTFAPGETSKTVTILINEDAYVEDGESFTVALSKPVGTALGQQSTTTVVITDDLPETVISPIDDAQQFVYTHYHDFLNREPDAAGLAFWTNEIESCGADAQCREVKRINVSAAFFLSIEFQQTGFLLHLLQKESYNSMPKYVEFMRDVQELGRDVIVGSPGWEQKLTDNQQKFVQSWASRSAFKAKYDGMSNAAFVDALYTNAGIVPLPEERDAFVTALDNGSESRATVLLGVAANPAFRQLEQNSSFVLMQYFGYLRRDPNEAPDSDLSGYLFWLNKLNNFNGNYIDAEMVKAFISSFEYRGRFAQ